MRLYHESKETNEEVYVPLVIAEEVPVAIPTNLEPTTTNPFINYQYVEAQAELAEEKYDEPPSDIKVIRFT